MQIVIDIPEVFFEAIKNTGEIVIGQRSGKTLMSVIYNAVAKGTPLPKGHGRLIDADMLWDLYHDNDYDFYEALDDVQTIIEADKAEGSDKE